LGLTLYAAPQLVFAALRPRLLLATRCGIEVGTRYATGSTPY